MTILESLVDLQEVDGRIRELELELKDLPRRKALETARLNGVSADLKAAQARHDDANQRVKNFEADAQAFKDQIQKLKVTQASLTDNKEYQQYSMQIDLINHNLEAAENSQLAAMDDLPSTQSSINAAQVKFDAEKGSVDAFCAEIDERIESVKAELAECNAVRAEKARAVDPKFLLHYERLRTKRWPVVVQLTHDGVCDGCHLVQPPSVAQMADTNERLAQEGREQVVVACTMCGRILYR